MEKMSEGDFQKLLQLALENLTLKRTILENQQAALLEELPTLEREDSLSELEGQLLAIEKDQRHYQAFVSDKPFSLENYY